MVYTEGSAFHAELFFWVQEMESSAAGVSYRVKNLGGYDVYKRVSVTGSSTEERKAE